MKTMSKRSRFTNALALLLLQMDSCKDVPLLDFVKRTTEEQKRLYEAGLSGCDGERIISKHQLGLAADIYLLSPDAKSIIDWKTIPLRSEYYHEFWETLGGLPVLKDSEGKPYDLGHFEF